MLNSLLDSPMDGLDQMGSATALRAGQALVVWRDDPTASPGYHVIVPIGEAQTLWQDLSRLAAPPPAAGSSPPTTARPLNRTAPPRPSAWPAGWAAFNTARIEAGRPLFGIDFDQTVLPAETGLLDRAVSFTKGCYLGQEIVARMASRGQVARRIAAFRMDGPELPVAGAPINDEAGQVVGIVTSSTASPLLSGAAIGLAMLRRTCSDIGSVVHVAAQGAFRPARVVEACHTGKPM
jgi:folate-binding protein YgfZ